MNNDIRAALLGDKEAAKRLTDAGVLLRCPFCGNKPSVYKHEFHKSPNSFGIKCYDCGVETDQFFATEQKACLAWNTRAPILSAKEMEMLEGME